MGNKTTINIELIIAASGSNFLIEDVPLTYTGEVFLEKFYDGLEMHGAHYGVEILYNGKFIEKQLIFSDVFEKRKKVKIELVTKSCAA